MSRLQAISYSNDLADISLTGIIHSVFGRTFNVLSEDGELYTVCQSDIFNGSRQIKISITDFSTLHIKAEMKVIETPFAIEVNQQTISLETEKKYIPIDLIFPEKLPKSLKKIIEDVDNRLKLQLDTVGFYKKTIENDVEKIMFDLLLVRSGRFIEGIKKESTELIRTSIKELIGLGHGLTPSGDDFLTGAALVMNSQNYPFPELTKIVNQEILANLENTNLISGNELRLAVSGKSLEPVLILIQSLYDEKNKQQIQQIIEKVLMIGSSSGSDILSGILMTLNATYDKLYELT